MDAASTPARPAHVANGILAAIERRPAAAVAVFILIHILLWTIVPALLQRNLQLDAIEGIAYGRDWQLSYWKHPPLPWLLMDITHRIFGTRLWPFLLLGQLAIAVAFWATWRLGCELFTPLEAFVAVVILDGSIEYGFNATAFNHNILELPLFALAGWSLYRAFAGNALRDWLPVGLWFALAFYTKYQAFVLLLPALAFALVDPQARQCWRKPGPYVAGAVSAVLCAPQFLWMALVDHFGPVKFAEGKAQSAQSLFDLLWSMLKFIIAGLLYIIPVVFLFLLLIGPVDRNRPLVSAPSDPFARRYLTFLTFGPLITCVIIGLLSGRRLQSGWAELSWCFISLYLIAQWRPPVDLAALGRLLVGWCGLTGVFIAAKIATEVFVVAQGYLIQSQFPGQQFSQMVTRAWHDEVGPAPLSYVVGEFWSAGNVIFYSPERPRMFEKGDATHSPRVDPADIRRRGAVILFDPQARLNKQPTPETSAPWLAQFPGAEARPPFVIKEQTPRGEITWAIGWALLKPQAAAGSAKQ